MAINMTPMGPYESQVLYQHTFAVGAAYEAVNGGSGFNHLLGLTPDEVIVIPVRGTKAGGSGYLSGTAADDTAPLTIPVDARAWTRSATQVDIQVYGTKGEICTFHIIARRVKRR